MQVGLVGVDLVDSTCRPDGVLAARRPVALASLNLLLCLAVGMCQPIVGLFVCAFCTSDSPHKQIWFLHGSVQCVK